MKLFIIYYTLKMNIKTNLLKEYVNFVHNTKEQNKYFKMFIFLIVVILCCFYFICFLNIIQNSICTISRLQV